MPERPTEPRIPPVDVADLPDDVRATAGVGASTVIQTLVRRQDLLTPWTALGGKLLAGGRLSARDRELAILRVALRGECEYEWANHVGAALLGGATSDEVLALTDASASWPAADAALLGAVDDLCADDCLSDATWASLRSTRDDGELIELLFVIGYYRMNAGILNSLGVQAEPGRPSLGTVPEAAPPSAVPVAADPTAVVHVDGTWHLRFHSPGGAQQLTLEVRCVAGQVTGSLTSPAAGVTTPVEEGAVEGNRVTFTTRITEPVESTLAWDGVVAGDSIAGGATIQGVGAIPFDGTRG